MGLAELDRPSFGGHETFPFRYTWLKKGFDAVGDDPMIFSQEDALITLGVGKNMVRSIRFWGLSCGILDEETDRAKRGSIRQSELGQKLFSDDGWDPYLEDPATLWLMHWRLASLASNCSTWWFIFNELGEARFSRQLVVDRLAHLARTRAWSKVSVSSLKRDVDTFFRSYVAPLVSRTKAIEDYLDCPLVELRLIREADENGSYEFVRGPQPTLPDEVFAFAVAEYLAAKGGAAKTVSAEELQYGQGAPGRVFLLDSTGVFSRLERLHRLSGGRWAFDDTAGVAQLLVHGETTPMKFLGDYFQHRDVAGAQ